MREVLIQRKRQYGHYMLCHVSTYPETNSTVWGFHRHRCKHSHERSSHLINENALWALSAVGRSGGVSRGGAGRGRRWGARGQRAHLNRPILRTRQTVKLQELIGDPVHHQQPGAVLQLQDPLHNLRDTQNLTLTETYQYHAITMRFWNMVQYKFCKTKSLSEFCGNAKFIGERKPFVHKHKVYWGNVKVLWTNANSEHKSFACEIKVYQGNKFFLDVNEKFFMGTQKLCMWMKSLLRNFVYCAQSLARKQKFWV